MSNPYGDFYPLSDRLPSPEKYDTPEDLAIQSMIVAEQLAEQVPFNYDAAEMHMRALAGLFNGAGGFDTPTYDRMPADARAASWNTAQACYEYFKNVGEAEKVTADLEYLFPAGPSERDMDSLLINRMQLHVSLAAMREQNLRTSLRYQNMRKGGSYELPADTWTRPEVMSARLQMDHPYSEDGIRHVLQVFGKNFGTVLKGLYETAPLDKDRRTMVHHASGCLKAADPANRLQ